MKRRRNKEKRSLRALRLWNYEEAARAVPYLRSVVGSLREHWIEAQRQRRASELLASRPGRPDRQRLLTSADLHTRQETAEGRFNDALDELMAIDVYLLDPVKGVYKKLVLRDGKVAGGVLLGADDPTGKWLRLFRSAEPVPATARVFTAHQGRSAIGAMTSAANGG